MARGSTGNSKGADSSPSQGTLNFSVLVRPPVPQLGYQKDGVVGCNLYGFAHLKEHLGLFEKSMGFPQVPRFYLLVSHHHHFIAVN